MLLKVRESRMNPLLRLLQPYPFERLRALHADAVPNRARSALKDWLAEVEPLPA